MRGDWYVKRVFCVGVFDLFHVGHLSLLQQAAALGHLTVGVVVDEAVTRVKGETRPVIKFHNRKAIIEALKCVSTVIPLNDFYIPELILENWDIIVVGADQDHVKGIDRIKPSQLRKVDRPKDGNCTSEIIKKLKEK